MPESRQGRQVTLADVAAAAGVSSATASRALNGGERKVGSDLKARVLAAAERLNYRVNVQAQAVARGRTDVVGLLVHDISDSFFSAIAAGVIAAADEHRLLVTLGSTQRSQEREIQHIASLHGQRARAAIVVGSRLDDGPSLTRLTAEVRDFEQAGGRVALIGQPQLGVDTVVMENRAGARELGRRLLELGYRDFAVVCGMPQLLTSRERVEGFTEALRDAGFAAPKLSAGEFTREGGYDATMRLIDQHSVPSCLVATSDVQAIGAMAALRDRGYDVPGDVAVAGFNDIVTARDVRPALTTVRFPLSEMGRTALEMVLQERAEEPRLRRVRGEVIVRESTPPHTSGPRRLRP